MILLVNASQISEKGDRKIFIPSEGIDRIADTLVGWKEEQAQAKKDVLQDLFCTLLHTLMTEKTSDHEIELPQSQATA